MDHLDLDAKNSLSVSVYIFMLFNTLLLLLTSSARSCVMEEVRVTEFKEQKRAIECNV